MIVNGFQRVCPPNHDDSSDDLFSDEEIEENYIDWRYLISNEDLYKITDCQPLEDYVHQQQSNWIGHVIRKENEDPTKILTFHSTPCKKRGRKVQSVLDRVVQRSQLVRENFIRSCFNRSSSPILTTTLFCFKCLLLFLSLLQCGGMSLSKV